MIIMAKGYTLPPGELLELYQLVRLYRSRYDLLGLMDEIAKKYSERTGGKDIEKASNPRGAGRKKQYDKDNVEEVRAVYEECKSVRETARRTGVSTTFVYKSIKQ